jgi:signal transduction histidine kinase
MYFRTRIFAISILTASSILAIVITLSWSRIMTVERDHLDVRLCMEAKRIIHMNRQPMPDGKPVELSGSLLLEDLGNKLRVNSSSHLMVWMKSVEDKVLTQTGVVDVEKLISALDWVDAKPNCQLASFEHDQNQWRAALFLVSDKKSFVGVDVAAISNELENTLREAMIFVIPFSLLFSIIGAWIITSSTIRPIQRLQKSMDLVTQKELSHRLPDNNEDKEFQVLIDAYNTMLDRLEDSFQQISRFTADAAHELKTPLTVLRGKLEQAVLSEDSSQLDLNSILDEVGHLSAITRKLLLLSQADSRSMALHFEAIDMTDLLDDLTADMELLAEDLVLHCSIERALTLKGDRVLLGQLFNNLLVNVMHYSLHDKGVTIAAKSHESRIEVVISNYCEPISDEIRNQLFDRFYRGESEQMHGISGSGLGLSLAREIARAHAGDLVLEATESNVFSMKLSLPIVK